MAKFKVKLKIKGFELEVEGEKKDVQQITNQLGNQLNNMVSPVAQIAESSDANYQDIPNGNKLPSKQTKNNRTISKNSSSKNTNSSSSTSGSSKKRDRTPAVALDLNVDPNKWTIPTQEWSTLEKSLWLLYMLKKEMKVNEARAKDIAATYNKHLRQTGEVRPTNVARDLGKSKSGKSALVGENTQDFPYKWYLTETGEKFVMDKMQGKE